VLLGEWIGLTSIGQFRDAGNRQLKPARPSPKKKPAEAGKDL